MEGLLLSKSFGIVAAQEKAEQLGGKTGKVRRGTEEG
jgi:hypothetical protein